MLATELNEVSQYKGLKYKKLISKSVLPKYGGNGAFVLNKYQILKWK